jgi:hypothetical protein
MITSTGPNNLQDQISSDQQFSIKSIMSELISTCRNLETAFKQNNNNARAFKSPEGYC